MNQKELDALVKQQAEQSSTAKSAYAYLVSLMTATEVDLDELKKNLDVLGRVKDQLDAESTALVVKALRGISQNKDFPDKFRQRVESQKRAVWGDLDSKDPIQKEIDAKIADLGDPKKKAEAIKWLSDNRAMLPPAPPDPPPAKLSIK